MKLLPKKIVKLLLPALCLPLLLCQPVLAATEGASPDPVSKAMADVDAKRYGEAYSIFKSMVERGEGGADALFMLGYLTEKGLGTGQDQFVAAGLYRRAWKAGSVPAVRQLDKLYEEVLAAPAASAEPGAPATRALAPDAGGKEKLRLVSGGTLSAITGDFTPGHLEVTRDILKELKFSPDAVTFTADASQDPDLYHWGMPGAHAQTANDETGRTSEDRDLAKAHFQEWMKELVRLMDREGERSPRKALYVLGYMLHAVQDLAAHRGITDAQHSYASYIDPGEAKDCDHDPENVALARELSRRLVERIRERRPAIYAVISTYRREGGSASATDNDRGDLFGSRSMNLSFSAYRRFESLAEKYKKIRQEDPFRPWEPQEIFAASLELF